MPSQRVAIRGNLVFYCLKPFKPPFILISHLRHFRTFTLNVHLLSLQTPLPITKNSPNQHQMAHTQVMCSYFNISNLLFHVFTDFFYYFVTNLDSIFVYTYVLVVDDDGYMLFLYILCLYKSPPPFSWGNAFENISKIPIPFPK